MCSQSLRTKWVDYNTAGRSQVPVLTDNNITNALISNQIPQSKGLYHEVATTKSKELRRLGVLQVISKCIYIPCFIFLISYFEEVYIATHTSLAIIICKDFDIVHLVNLHA